MPGFDGSGPMGGGPMTGGARGYCNPSYAGYDRPIGFGRGMAYGRGFRGGYGPGRGGMRGYGGVFPQSQPVYAREPADELNVLKQQADSIKNTLDSINSRIAELKNIE
ncbi:MAG: DUF5320 domain-containing protein [Desulfobacteraceae bacterium]|nr:DUF5320 domain-containing protein [Desulfobacteraceae bacterium]MBC2756570.1 DUF5320 domain-containing protein [Desulfobacteraceae bacterium]